MRSAISNFDVIEASRNEKAIIAVKEFPSVGVVDELALQEGGDYVVSGRVVTEIADVVRLGQRRMLVVHEEDVFVSDSTDPHEFKDLVVGPDARVESAKEGMEIPILDFFICSCRVSLVYGPCFVQVRDYQKRE